MIKPEAHIAWLTVAHAIMSLIAIRNKPPVAATDKSK